MSRSHAWEGATITYPNATHYAFTPAIVSIAGVPTSVKGLGVTIADPLTGTVYAEFREVFGGEVSVDICRYLQLMFVAAKHTAIDYGAPLVDSPLKHTAEVAVYKVVGQEKQVIMSTKIDVLWGGIRLGESSAAEITRRWFVDFPFTVDVFTSANTTITITTDGEVSTLIDTDAAGATRYRRRLLNPKLFANATTAKTMRVIIENTITLHNDTEGVGVASINLQVNDGCSGVYLRWIDHQGRFCYFLFKQLSDAFATGVTEAWDRRSGDVPTAYTDGVNVATTRQQTLETKSTTALGAKLVDIEMFDFLLTLSRSPVVDLFDGYDQAGLPLWQRVTVVAGNYTRTSKSLQDFTLTIERAPLTTQTM